MKPYFASILFALSMIGLTAHAADDDEIIEFQGDRYVIHVDKMNPDSEMTLLDVLNTCPEFLSINGKKIDQNYKFRADNIGLVVDPQSFLANVKACEIDRIQICSNTSVAKAVNGTKGVIDIYYRKDVKTDGKVALSGRRWHSQAVPTAMVCYTPMWPTGAKNSPCRPMPWFAVPTGRPTPPMSIA